MNGIKINFSKSGPRFDFSAPVKDFASTVQNALVNVGTDLGSDNIFPERGTDLKRDGAQGRMATTLWAGHSANFAALRTLAFSQQTDVTTNSWKLRSFSVNCQQVVLDKADLAIQAISSDGQVVGSLATI